MAVLPLPRSSLAPIATLQRPPKVRDTLFLSNFCLRASLTSFKTSPCTCETWPTTGYE